MRCLLAAALCCLLAATAFAQQSGLPSAPNSVAGGPANQVWATPCSGQGQASFRGLCAADVPAAGLGINVLNFGADPTGTNDSTTAFQNAVNAACPTNSAATPGTVLIPSGTYKQLGTVNIPCSPSPKIAGSGRNTPAIIRTGATGDAFYWATNPVAAYLNGGAISNIRLYRNDNPTAGAGLHLNNMQLFTCRDTEVTGEFIGVQVESSLNVKFDGCDPDGSNTSSGSALWKWNKSSAGGSSNNAANFIANSNSQSTVGTYTYGMLLENSDGLKFCCHLYGAKTAGVYFLPQTTADAIDNIDFTGTNMDTNGIGWLCINANLPVGYSRLFSPIVIGTEIELSTTDGIQSNCPEFSDVNAIGTEFLLNGANGANITAGGQFHFDGATFNANNFANGGSDAHLTLGGTVSGVSLNGAQFLLASGFGAHAVPYDIVTSGSATNIFGTGLVMSGAATGPANNGASGSVDLEGVAADGTFSAGSCTGLGTGACAIVASSIPQSGLIQLAPTGSPSAAGTVVVTLPIAANHRYICSAAIDNGATAWNTGAAITSIYGTPATMVIVWSNNGTNLTASGIYLIAFQCRPH